jgi:hypothetical protein
MDRVETPLALLLLDPFVRGSINGPESLEITPSEPQRYAMYATAHLMWQKHHDDWSALVAVYVTPRCAPYAKPPVSTEELRRAHRTYRRIFKMHAKRLGVTPANYFAVCTAPTRQRTTPRRSPNAVA